MTFRETKPAQPPVTERRTAPRAQVSGSGTPIPPLADVEYANSLGVEYFSLPADGGQGASAPRSIPDGAKQQ